MRGRARVRGRVQRVAAVAVVEAVRRQLGTVWSMVEVEVATDLLLGGERIVEIAHRVRRVADIQNEVG